MKKILCFAIIMMMLLGVVSVSVSAQEKPSFTLDQKYREEVLSALGFDATADESCNYYTYFGYNADGTIYTGEATPDYVVVDVSYGLSSPSSHYRQIGNYMVKSNRINEPYDLGYHIYSTAEGKVYNLDEAYEADLAGIEYVLSVFGSPVENSDTDWHKSKVLDLLSQKYMTNWDKAEFYREVYSCYKETSSDEASLAYVLVNTYLAADPMYSVECIGEYAVLNNYWEPTYKTGYFVYLPDENEVLTLSEAYDAEVECIERVFEESGIEAGLLGDADQSGRLDVKDATAIQKQIAGIASGEQENTDALLYETICDFNRDGERNVKDATAIQKYIAGLEY